MTGNQIRKGIRGEESGTGRVQGYVPAPVACLIYGQHGFNNLESENGHISPLTHGKEHIIRKNQ